MITVVVSPVKGGRFNAHVDGVLICTSRTPFFTAARQLITDGHDPTTIAVMRHAGSDFEAMRAPLGIAAKLTVEENPVLRFAMWKQFDGLDDGSGDCAGSSSIRANANRVAA